MAKKLEWQHVGPEREKSIEVPGISIGNYAYVLVHDPKRDRIVYIHAKEYGGDSVLWTWDGKRWEKAKTRTKLEDEVHAFYDTSRGGIAVWSVVHDYDLERHVPRGTIVDGKEIKTTGEPPLIEPDSDDSFFLSSNFGCAMAYDVARQVTVCLTRRGVYELDAAGAWTRRADGHAAEWHNDAGGTWDPVGKRCVFWIQCEEDRYKHVLFAWDGKKLEKLSQKGLPDLCIWLFDPCAMFVGHPKHGVVCHVGGTSGMYALAGNAWKRLPDASDPPPKMAGRFSNLRPRLAYHDKFGFVIGPGTFEDQRSSDTQQVFWVLKDKAWQRYGAVGKVSPIKSIGNRKTACVDGTWYVVSRGDMQTFAWIDDAWKELVDAKTGAKLVGTENVEALAATPEGLVAVTNKGSVWRLEKSAWKRVSKASSVFKDRDRFSIVHDGTRLVVWGGDVKNRKSNDTLVFDGKAWAVAGKQTSPTPKDWKQKDMTVDFPLVHDAALGRVVRFGYTEAATLEDGVWKPVAPKQYTLDARWYEHMPAHDPVTGETLYVDFSSQKIKRFDLGGCAEVATFAYPKELVAEAKRERESVDHKFYELCVFDPKSRSIHSQHVEDNWARYRLDLGPAFDAAKKLGARKLLGAPKAVAAKAGPVTLYKWTKGKVETWRGDAKQADAKRKAGFLPALELPHDALEALGTLRSCALVVKKKKPASHATSRLGGLPSGITEKTWPKDRGSPMGFLFQLVTDRVPGYAGVAVFCVTDGTATEDDTNNRAVWLTAKQLATAPVKQAPAGVKVLAEQSIVIEEPLPEIHEDLVEKLAAKDPDLAAAFERYQDKAEVQEAHLGSKLGGMPTWLQDAAGGPDGFIAQLDFDTLSVNREWGLAGCIYVYEGKKGPIASWQYT